MKIVIEGNTIDGSARSTLNVFLSGARGPQGPAGEAGASEWGDIGGTLSEQTDLQAALDAKVDENAAITGATKTKITYDSKGLVTAGADAGIADISGLQTALDAKVPYTGATQDVNLGEFGLVTGNIEFDTTPTNAPTAAGSMYYDDTSGTVVNILKGGNVISKIGETQHVRVYNNTGSPIAKGKVVAINGAQGQRPTIILADADSETLSKDTIGFTAEAIADGAEGFVMIAGVLTNVSTSGMVDGDTLYLSTTAGSYTNVKPEAPVHMVILGFVVNGGSGGAGQIYVKVDNGYELEELHNLKETPKTTAVDADALLLKDSADSNLWKPFSWLNAKAGIKAHMDTFKGVAGGYASLDGGGKVPASELPSYVDDVIEAANFAALPATGETGKIYVTLDNNKCYRWSGSAYIEISAGGGIDTLTTTGTSGAATLVGSTLNIPQYQSALTNPVTGTGTSGQVAYWNGTTTQTGSSAFVFNAVNQRVGLGTNAPSGKLEIVNTIADLHTFKVRASGTPLPSFTIEDGDITIPNYNGSGVNPIINANEVGRVSALGSAIGGLQIFGFSNASDERALIITAASGKTTATSNPILLFRSQKHDGSTSFADLSSTDIAFGWANRNTRIAQMFGNGNFLLQNGGTYTDNGQRLQVYGSTLLRGSGTTSATTALLVQNSTPTELFKVLDNGNANFGTGLYWDNANRFLGLSISSPLAPLHVASVNADLVNAVFQYSDDRIFGAALILRKSRGSVTSPSAVLLNDRLGLFGFAGYDGTTYNNSAVIIGNAEENWTSEARGSRYSFELTANGTTSRTEYMRIRNNGNVLIQNGGTFTDNGQRLQVIGSTLLRGSGTTSATTALLVQNTTPTANFTIRDDGGYAFRGGTVGLAQTGYTTFTNLTTDRTCDANATTVEELADILGTLIEDLKTKGIISA